MNNTRGRSLRRSPSFDLHDIRQIPADQKVSEQLISLRDKPLAVSFVIDFTTRPSLGRTPLATWEIDRTSSVDFGIRKRGTTGAVPLWKVKNGILRRCHENKPHILYI